jgi:membrane protease YdiL (CAAX protease family)
LALNIKIEKKPALTGGIMEQTATPTATKPFPRFWVSFGWVLLYFALQIVMGIIAIAIVAVQKGLSDPNAIAALAQNLPLIALPTMWSLVAASLLTLAMLGFYLSRKGRASAIYLDRWSQMDLGPTIAMSVGLVLIGFGFNYLYATYVFPDIQMQESTRKLFEAIPKTTMNMIMLFSVVAIFAPLLEELLFRGLLQTSLSHYIPNWAAIALSAAIFAAFHGDPFAFPALMALGAVFGIIYYKTGSLRVTILLHMLNNAAALAIG